MKKDKTFSLDFIQGQAQSRQHSRAKTSENPIFSVVSSCVGSPRRFVEDYANFRFDYQSYLMLANNRSNSPSPQISDRRKNASSQLFKSSFKNTHTRGLSSPGLLHIKIHNEFLKTFNSNKGKLDK